MAPSRLFAILMLTGLLAASWGSVLAQDEGEVGFSVLVAKSSYYPGNRHNVYVSLAGEATVEASLRLRFPDDRDDRYLQPYGTLGDTAEAYSIALDADASIQTAPAWGTTLDENLLLSDWPNGTYRWVLSVTVEGEAEATAGVSWVLDYTTPEPEDPSATLRLVEAGSTTTDVTRFYPPESVDVRVSLSGLNTTGSSASTVLNQRSFDLYFGYTTPAGQLYTMASDGSFVAGLHALTVWDGVTVTTFAATTQDFAYGDPAGTYTWYLGGAARNADPRFAEAFDLEPATDALYVNGTSGSTGNGHGANIVELLQTGDTELTDKHSSNNGDVTHALTNLNETAWP